MIKDNDRICLRVVLFVSFVLTILSTHEIIQITQLMGVALLRSTWTVVLGIMVFCAILLGILFGMTWKEWLFHFYRYPDVFLKYPLFWKSISFLLFAILMVIYPWLIMKSPYRFYLLSDPSTGLVVAGWQKGAYLLYDVLKGTKILGSTSNFLTNPALHLWFFWMIGVISVLVLKIGNKDLNLGKALIFTYLSQAIVYKTATFLPDISSYPFSLGWSEASRYYYASLLFAKRIYGMYVPLSAWHPTRYFLQSLPFIIPGLSIQAHRLWQVMLWIMMMSATALLLARRLRIQDGWIRWSFVLWVILFLFQGAVYYHLLVCIWIVLAGFSIDHPRRSFAVILLASFWAGMSRFNWYPVPSMLAGALYLLEKPLKESHNLKSYLVQPAVWLVAGVTTAVLAQGLYIRLSGNEDLSAFGSSLTSDLLWYRLWPNPTYPPGVVPGILLVSVPTLALIILFLYGRIKYWNAWRLIGLGTYLVILFTGGLVVSTKIGGGGDLHNMDAYMVFVLIFGSYVFFSRFTPDLPGLAPRSIHWILITLTIIVPIGFVISRVSTLESYEREVVKQNMDILSTSISEASQKGEVLFITQRHLLTFDLVDAPLIPEYEVVTLMEMAMSGNTNYLEHFYTDLHQHRFQLIVAGKQSVKIKGRDYSFGEENDAWVQNIAIPLLCEYQPAISLDDIDVQLFIPRENGGNCFP